MLEVAPVEVVAEQFAKLPGIGRKTARRLAYHVLKMPEEDVRVFSETVLGARKAVRYCEICGLISDSDTCEICSSPKRDHSVVCVVRDSKDVFALERASTYNGVYHILGGTISPLDNVGPDDIAIATLMSRVAAGGISEVILATNPDVQGEATAAYIARLLSGVPGVRVTRIAHGVPVGAELEFADEVTLARALAGRREVK